MSVLILQLYYTLIILHNVVARMRRNCYYQLRQIRRITRSLTANSITLLVLASVHSRLEYCIVSCNRYLGRVCSYCSLC